MQNKPFTELPAPRRTHRLSIVAVWNQIDPPTMQCENAGCKQEEDIEEIVECPVCGRWMCHACSGGIVAVLTKDHCPDCSKLTAVERQAVMELRARLGGAR